MAEPDAETCTRLLGVLGEFVARAGAAPLLLPPVAPGDDAFPDPWANNRAGVTLLLRRLAWHAGLDRAIEVERREVGAPPTDRMPATRVPLLEIRQRTAVFAFEFLGSDDVVGTLAHEIGVAFAVLHPRGEADPYRTAEPPTITVDPEVDLERGSIAAVYLGLGVLAANAAHQNHTVLQGQGFDPLLVSPVAVELAAGYLPVSSLTYLLAVQAVLRGEREPPAGLSPPQHREVETWIATLDRTTVRDWLGVAVNATPGERPAPTPFADASLEPDAPLVKHAFRWRTHRGGVGFVAGMVTGIGAAFAISSPLMPAIMLGGALFGHLIGRQVVVPRCSACATPLPRRADSCPACRAVMRGDINQLGDRLAAEESLQDQERS